MGSSIQNRSRFIQIMNIHEHQAKQILKKFGAVVPEGVFGFTVEELLENVSC